MAERPSVRGDARYARKTPQEYANDREGFPTVSSIANVLRESEIHNIFGKKDKVKYEQLAAAGFQALVILKDAGLESDKEEVQSEVQSEGEGAQSVEEGVHPNAVEDAHSSAAEDETFHYGTIPSSVMLIRVLAPLSTILSRIQLRSMAKAMQGNLRSQLIDLGLYTKKKKMTKKKGQGRKNPSVRYDAAAAPASPSTRRRNTLARNGAAAASPSTHRKNPTVRDDVAAASPPTKRQVQIRVYGQQRPSQRELSKPAAAADGFDSDALLSDNPRARVPAVPPNGFVSDDPLSDNPRARVPAVAPNGFVSDDPLSGNPRPLVATQLERFRSKKQGQGQGQV
jgi:hypothetical protein